MQHIVFLCLYDILLLDRYLAVNILKYIHMIMRMDMKTYSTAEAAIALGISKNTLLRWIRERKVRDVKRDRNKWRIFTDSDITRIKKEIERASK